MKTYSVRVYGPRLPLVTWEAEYESVWDALADAQERHGDTAGGVSAHLLSPQPPLKPQPSTDLASVAERLRSQAQPHRALSRWQEGCDDAKAGRIPLYDPEIIGSGGDEGVSSYKNGYRFGLTRREPREPDGVFVAAGTPEEPDALEWVALN